MARAASPRSTAAMPDDVHRFCPHPVNLDYFWRAVGGIEHRRQWCDTLAAAAAGVRPCTVLGAAGRQRWWQQALPLWQARCLRRSTATSALDNMPLGRRPHRASRLGDVWPGRPGAGDRTLSVTTADSHAGAQRLRATWLDALPGSAVEDAGDRCRAFAMLLTDDCCRLRSACLSAQRAATSSPMPSAGDRGLIAAGPTFWPIPS